MARTQRQAGENAANVRLRLWLARWLAYALTTPLFSLEAQAQSNNQESDAINRKRKADQLQAQPKMQHNTMEYWQYMHKNHTIEAACQSLERDVKRLKTEALSRYSPTLRSPASSASCHPHDESQRAHRAGADLRRRSMSQSRAQGYESGSTLQL